MINCFLSPLPTGSGCLEPRIQQDSECELKRNCLKYHCLPPTGEGGVVTSVSIHWLPVQHCFSQARYLPQVSVPSTRQVRHFGGPPTRQPPPLLSLLLRQENHIPPSCLHGSQGQSSNRILVNEMSAEACGGASGGTFISLTASCLAWVECPEVTNSMEKEPVIAKNNRMETQKWSGF